MKNAFSARQLLGWILVGILFLVVCPALSFQGHYKDGPSPTRVFLPTKESNSAAALSALELATATKVSGNLKACVGDANINVRQGPGTQYSVTAGLPAGTCMAVLGRNLDSTWVYMTTGDKTGWVAGWLVDVKGQLSNAPIQSISNPLPASTAAVVQQPQNKKNRHAQSSGSQSQSSSSVNTSSGGGSAPGPTAQCNDGTYSYSTHRNGTCSYHGGVAVWLH